MGNRFEVAVGAGSMMSAADTAAHFPHRWTLVASRWKPISPARICFIWPRPAVSSTMGTGKLRPWESDCRASA